MRSTYENVYIGTFIFCLGYMFSAKKKGYRTSVAIELYQQTRHGERLVGDLLTSIGGKCIILEFKRDEAALGEELRKKSKAQLRNALRTRKDEKFVEISKRCHHVAFATEYAPSEEQCLGFLPYVDLVMSDPNTQYLSDRAFCQQYLSDTSYECGVSPEDFKYYIEELANISGGTCGGAAVTVDKDGLKSLVVFDDVRELNKSLVLAEQHAEFLGEDLESGMDGPNFGPG